MSPAVCKVCKKKIRKVTPCKYKQHFCCLKILQYSFKILHVAVCIVVTNFTNAWKLVKEVSFANQRQVPPRLALEWVLIGYILFIMRSVLNLKRRTRETCKTRHSLIFTGQNPVR